ncbi:DinB family protein [Paenibacillus flagellatus]|uniref:Damage-inducible protein DinB n=1 Tax=Paenibacillus flagellatus TaxID=2211139 RepID=A0A2V5K5T0_9BACL|nr:DinB family protein [Paenibacillus flagellatus]PYI53093.1 damage-inducible protein DinB [Paenibacillus flagellatus]
MSVVQHLLEELRREAASTRRVMERIPEASLTWKPHAKSMSLGQLALHTAGLPGGLAVMLNALEREVPTVPLPEAGSVAEILAVLEEQAAIAEDRIRSWGDEGLRETFRWTLQGAVLSETARLEQVRSVLFNHWYHHRGQLTVYLRLLDVPLPGIYGPTADE